MDIKPISKYGKMLVNEISKDDSPALLPIITPIKKKKGDYESYKIITVEIAEGKYNHMVDLYEKYQKTKEYSRLWAREKTAYNNVMKQKKNMINQQEGQVQ